jgi:hypothetical protein
MKGTSLNHFFLSLTYNEHSEPQAASLALLFDLDNGVKLPPKHRSLKERYNSKDGVDPDMKTLTVSSSRSPGVLAALSYGVVGDAYVYCSWSLERQL